MDDLLRFPDEFDFLFPPHHSSVLSAYIDKATPELLPTKIDGPVPFIGAIKGHPMALRPCRNRSPRNRASEFHAPRGYFHRDESGGFSLHPRFIVSPSGETVPSGWIGWCLRVGHPAPGCATSGRRSIRGNRTRGGLRISTRSRGRARTLWRGNEASVRFRSLRSSARTCRWGCQFKNSPAVWMKTMAAGRALPPVFSRRNEERAFQAHRLAQGGKRGASPSSKKVLPGLARRAPKMLCAQEQTLLLRLIQDG